MNIPALMPESILVAYLQSNTLSPQENSGVRVLTGKAVVDAYLQPDVDGPALWNSGMVPSDTQATKAMQALEALHAYYDVTCEISEGKGIPRDRVEQVIGSTVTNARYGISLYARRVTSGEFPPNGPTFEGIGQLLFSRTESGALVRPEGLALHGMWGVAKAALLSSEGLDALETYRTTILEIKEGRRSPAFNRARGKVRHELRVIAEEHIHNAVPHIQEKTGVTIDDMTVTLFLHQNELNM